MSYNVVIKYTVLDESCFSYIGWFDNLPEALDLAKWFIDDSPEEIDFFSVVKVSWAEGGPAKYENMYHGQEILDAVVA